MRRLVLAARWKRNRRRRTRRVQPMGRRPFLEVLEQRALLAGLQDFASSLDAIAALDASTWNSGDEEYSAVGYVSEAISDDFIAVDLTQTYHLSGTGRSGNDDGSEFNDLAGQYFGFASYDENYDVIFPQHYQKSSASAVDTTLVDTLEVGDTSLRVVDATGWYDDSAAYARGLAWWHATASQYPV